MRTFDAGNTMNIVAVTLRRLVPRISMLSIAIAVMHSPSAKAESGYTYTTVATSNAVGGLGLSIPSINDNGTVAFVDSSNNVLDLGNGGPLTPVVTSSLYFGAYGAGTEPFSSEAVPAINDAGTTAFWARTSLPNGAVNNSGILTGTSGGLSTIVSGGSPIGSAASADYSRTPMISDGGTVVLALNHVDTPGTGVYFWNGAALTPLATSTTLKFINADPAISHNGTIAYEFPIAGSSGGITGYALYTYANGVTTEIASNNNQGLQATFYGALAVNDSGTVVAASEFKIQLASGGGFTTLATATTSFSTFGAVSINNPGEVVFYANLEGGGAGIFTGTDIANDKVIAVGDPLDGSTVASIGFAHGALNDRGQVTFWAKLQNGDQGIFIANPVPEPSAWALAMLATGILLLGLRRKAAVT
jgi:PEP-CTERM motif